MLFGLNATSPIKWSHSTTVCTLLRSSELVGDTSGEGSSWPVQRTRATLPHARTVYPLEAQASMHGTTSVACLDPLRWGGSRDSLRWTIKILSAFFRSLSLILHILLLVSTLYYYLELQTRSRKTRGKIFRFDLHRLMLCPITCTNLTLLDLEAQPQHRYTNNRWIAQTSSFPTS